MRRTCHICLASHEEAMFRSIADINYLFNCFALACLETESRPLADSELTTHFHLGVQTDDPVELVRLLRYLYTRHFNYKYRRSGRIGEKNPFILEVSGLLHIQTMLTYVFRQGLHHGLSPTAFGYPHSSVNAIFLKELGKSSASDILPRRGWGKFLPDRANDIPTGYRMDRSGLFLREDVIDTEYVQEIYVSPRNFLYQMNRISNDKWLEEQNGDRNGLPPVTLETVEPQSCSSSISQLLANESGRVNYGRITDLELCALIDCSYLREMGTGSIYDLSQYDRAGLGNRLLEDFAAGRIESMLGRNPGFPDSAQIRRCAVIL